MAVKCPKCQAENPGTARFCLDCGTQLIGELIRGHQPDSPEFGVVPRDLKTETLQAPIKELTTGSTFAGRYQIIEELGKGGMGRVYKVFDQEVQAKMALKLIKPEVSADKDTIDRFRNELKIARDISHKNICRMYDLGREAGSYFITMEYVSGEDLKSFIRRAKQLVVGTAIFIAKQVCEGLAEAHRQGVVHRDLKPGNIMIDKEGNAKIMDFGIARSVSVKGITGGGIMIGTPEYMSPEQVEGKEVDQRSDIYSLGIMLYEMLTGQVPFEGDTPFSVGVKQKSEIPKDPRGLNAQIPQDLSRLILKCLEKDRERRYRNADELRADLEKIEKGIPTAERPVPKRKTVTSKPITLTVSRKKFFVPLAVIAAIAVIGIALWRILPKRQAVTPPTGKPTLAVLYFKNNTGDEKLDIWRSGLSDLMVSALSQSKYINVLSSDQIFSLLKKLNLLEAKIYASEDLREVASNGGATHILQGYYTKAGDNFRINITLQKADTGEILGSENAEGPGEQSFFPMVDELIRKVKADFQFSSEQLATDLEKEVQTITTSSPEAYKYYVESRKYHYNVEYAKCVPLLEKAIALDPEFAMAYRALGSAVYNLGDWVKGKALWQKALDLSSRLSEKERYFIQGEVYFWAAPEKDWEKAIQSFNRLLELYPDDSMANYELGTIYRSLEEWDKSITYFEVCRENRYGFLASYVYLADNYRSKELYGKADEVLEYCLENISDSARTHLYMARNYVAQGKMDSALAEVEKAMTRDPTFPLNSFHYARILMYKGDLAKARLEFLKFLEGRNVNVLSSNYMGLLALDLLEGKYDQAEKDIAQAIERMSSLGAKSNEAEFRTRLAYGYLRLGRPEKALEQSETVRRLALELANDEGQRWALHLKGLSYLRMAVMSDAQKTAEELKQMIESGINKKKIRYYTHLAGMIELERKNYAKAVEYLRNAVELLPWGPLEKDASFIDSLALAYYRSADLEKARETYERIIALTLGRFTYGEDIYAKSFYMLGKIHEQQGQKDKAIENYQKFIDLWKDADPGIAEVEDAGKRLAALKR